MKRATRKDSNGRLLATRERLAVSKARFASSRVSSVERKIKSVKGATDRVAGSTERVARLTCKQSKRRLTKTEEGDSQSGDKQRTGSRLGLGEEKEREIHGVCVSAKCAIEHRVVQILCTFFAYCRHLLPENQ